MRYKYDVVRSARKSIAVVITSYNKITVHCPWGLRVEEIEKFLDGKEKWIEKVVYKNSLTLAANDDVIELNSIYVGGKKLPLVFGAKSIIASDAVYVTSAADIKKVFIAAFSEKFRVRVEEFAEKAVLYPKSVEFKDYYARWGCCDASNNLIFNYRLFMLPQDVQDYVIVHELCHTLCHNHSQAFWRLVAEFAPNYKQSKKQLAKFDFLTSLY